MGEEICPAPLGIRIAALQCDPVRPIAWPQVEPGAQCTTSLAGTDDGREIDVARGSPLPSRGELERGSCPASLIPRVVDGTDPLAGLVPSDHPAVVGSGRGVVTPRYVPHGEGRDQFLVIPIRLETED